MHDGMQYDPIERQGQGHEPFKFGNLAIFKSYLLRQGAANSPLILKLGHNIYICSGRIFDIWPSFCVT